MRNKRETSDRGRDAIEARRLPFLSAPPDRAHEAAFRPGVIGVCREWSRDCCEARA